MRAGRTKTEFHNSAKELTVEKIKFRRFLMRAERAKDESQGF